MIPAPFAGVGVSVAFAWLAPTASAQPLSFSTPFTPAVPAAVGASWSGVLDASAPLWRRAGQSLNETAATPPGSLGNPGSYPYSVHSFVAPVSGVFQFYSAQAHDGYLHLYRDAFNPANQFANILAGDDDMTTLYGGAVPNRNGLPGTSDSGFQLNLSAGTTYVVVNTTYAPSLPSDGRYYNEIRSGGRPASPIYAIPDMNPAGVSITLNIPATETRTIVSFDSLGLVNLNHTFVNDLVVTLTHLESGLTTTVLNREGGSSDVRGDYRISDSGAPWTGADGLFEPGTYASANPLAIFAGDSLAGTWVLNISDNAGQDVGAISAFSINVTAVPGPSGVGVLVLAGLLARSRGVRTRL
ncbi:MAG: proprotein convertase P-domain-containing protein [Planctomycetes bacterium]|nr:proprotein convertase P-domain-containing protein [Planctomycetota bacterium]